MIEYIERLLQGTEVQWKTLGEVADYIRGVTYNKSDEIDKGEGWKVLRANNILLNSRSLIFEDVKLINKNVHIKEEQHLYKGDILICAGSGSKGHIGKSAYINKDIDYVFGGFMGVIRIRSLILNSRYLYLYLGSKAFYSYLEKSLRSSTINNLNSSIMNSFTIPIPPLSVQREIVRILDKFTELEAELEAELECRRKQYGYYLHYLFDFAKRGIEVRRMKIGEIGKICMCKRILKNQTTSSGDIPFYKIGTFGGVPDAYISQALFEDYKNRYPYPQKGDILISASGTIGKTVVFDGTPSYFQDSNIVWLKHNEEFVLNSYLKYCYCLKPWSVAKGGTIERLYNDNILRAVISVPQIEEQQRIVRILDRFDVLTNSISEGLPREIELRRKQYEYYRERLLSFDNDNA